MFSRWTVPAWFWLAWAMLEEIHQTKFVSELIGDIRQFVPEHPVVATAIGLGALFVFALWPEYIKPWWPSWLKYTPLHEKVDTLEHRFSRNEKDLTERHVPRIDRLDSVPERLSSLEALTNSGVATPAMLVACTETMHELTNAVEKRSVDRLIQLGKDVTESAQKVSNSIITRFAKVEDAVQVLGFSLTERLDEHKNWIRDVEIGLGNANNSLGTLKELFESRLMNSLVIDARTSYNHLPPAQKQALKIIYNQPGLTVRDVSERLVKMGIIESMQAISALRDTSFVRPGSGEQLYPTDNVIVLGEIEQLLKELGS
jgi:hypothetical protein